MYKLLFISSFYSLLIVSWVLVKEAGLSKIKGMLLFAFVLPAFLAVFILGCQGLADMVRALKEGALTP